MVLIDPSKLHLKNRLDDLEVKIEEIRGELKIDENIDAKIDELRKKIKETEKDEDFFRWIKGKGLTKGSTVSQAIEKMEAEAKAHLDEDNFKKLYRNHEYCKLANKRENLRQHAYVGCRYQEFALKEKQKLLRRIKLLEHRKLQLSQNKYCIKN